MFASTLDTIISWTRQGVADTLANPTIILQFETAADFEAGYEDDLFVLGPDQSKITTVEVHALGQIYLGDLEPC